MSAGRKRIRVQGFEIPVGDVVGLIRWFPLEGEWRHELVTGSVLGLDKAGHVQLVVDGEARTFDPDTWAVCAAVPEPLKGLAS